MNDSQESGMNQENQSKKFLQLIEKYKGNHWTLFNQLNPSQMNPIM